MKSKKGYDKIQIIYISKIGKRGMLRVNKKTNSTIFRSIFISYIAVCIITLVITGFGYGNLYHLFKDNAIFLARQQADTVISQVESGFMQIRQALDVLEEDLKNHFVSNNSPVLIG